MKLRGVKVGPPHTDGGFYILKVTPDHHASFDLRSAGNELTMFEPKLADLREARFELTKLIDRMVHDAPRKASHVAVPQP